MADIMKWKLIATIERTNGTLFRQNVRYLTEEESKNKDLIHKLLRNYQNELGEDYFLIDYYIGY